MVQIRVDLSISNFLILSALKVVIPTCVLSAPLYITAFDSTISNPVAGCCPPMAANLVANKAAVG